MIMQRQPRMTAQGAPEKRAPLRRPGARTLGLDTVSGVDALDHENQRLKAYDTAVKSAFDRVVPTVRELVAHQFETDFVERASTQIRETLALEPPVSLLERAWTDGLDVKELVSHLTLSTYLSFANQAIQTRPLAHPDCDAFQAFLAECGFHRLDITPCADGRMAHVIRYVLRLPAEIVRRKAYAGAVFEIEDTLAKWAQVELTRDHAAAPSNSRYLKIVAYHLSSVDGHCEGCAAHGSDDAVAAAAGRDALLGLKSAAHQTFGRDDAIEGLLIGVDTANDRIRLHLPNADGSLDLDAPLEAIACQGLDRMAIEAYVCAQAPFAESGMQRLAARLIEHNLHHLAYLNDLNGGQYADIGHAERFIGIGVGFDEIQLRNLMYFGYLSTLEEGARDVDVGLKIFKGLNQSRGLATPIVIRFDYYGSVPGARDRAHARAERVAQALNSRYAEPMRSNNIHFIQVSRDLDRREPLELLGSNLPSMTEGALA